MPTATPTKPDTANSEPTRTTEQDFADVLLTKADKLHAEREANTQETAKNRMMLRGLADTPGTLTDEQVARINKLYPKQARKPKPSPAPDAMTPGAAGQDAPKTATPDRNSKQ